MIFHSCSSLHSNIIFIFFYVPKRLTIKLKVCQVLWCKLICDCLFDRLWPTYVFFDHPIPFKSDFIKWFKKHHTPRSKVMLPHSQWHLLICLQSYFHLVIFLDNLRNVFFFVPLSIVHCHLSSLIMVFVC